MGVTTHSPTELDYPFTMTNVRSGTWMMTGNGVMHNGTTVIELYGQNLDRLQVGDRVGVMRKPCGTLHFWVNGIDQGAAATGVPERVYGVIDLYGQAAQASIVDAAECDGGSGSPMNGMMSGRQTTSASAAAAAMASTSDGLAMSSSMVSPLGEPRLRFHACHGRNARISNGGQTASRPKALAEFNGSIVFSNRPLRQRELFEVRLETMIDHWNGSVEIGVTGVRPDEITMASTATDLDQDTVMISGSTLMHNGTTVRNDMPFDLDALGAGSRIGVMRVGDAVHFYVNGIDQGVEYECSIANMHAVVDLYGQCAQVSITPASGGGATTTAQPMDGGLESGGVEVPTTFARLDEAGVVDEMVASVVGAGPRAPYAMSENSQSFQATSVIQPMMEARHRYVCIGFPLDIGHWFMMTSIRGNELNAFYTFIDNFDFSCPPPAGRAHADPSPSPRTGRLPHVGRHPQHRPPRQSPIKMLPPPQLPSPVV